MRIEHLSLTNFRNYARLEWTLPPGTTLIHGANAQGKTSLLEAICYLALSRSPWSSSDRQLIHWRAQEEPIPFARLSAEISSHATARWSALRSRCCWKTWAWGRHVSKRCCASMARTSA